MIRLPQVAGQFYPGTESSLRQEVQRLLTIGASPAKEKALGIIAPHAGFMYSGAVAGHVYSAIQVPGTIFILGPNHTGIGKRFSLHKQGHWRTPLGDVEVDSEIAQQLLKSCKYLDDDTAAHTYEHCLETQLPFLQYIKSDFKIVPIVLSAYNSDAYRSLGEAIASVAKNLKKDFLIIASSDMSHYEGQKDAQKKDKKAIDAILKLDELQLINCVEGLNITMCGYIPAAIMLIAAKLLGAKEARLVKYQTSADVTGDYNAVVGYAGVIIT
ncbi:MAG: AmmeMemoRadiSam system protein B [Candidatus Omnitrophota bacterium]